MGSGAKLCTKRSREEWKDAGPSENDEELLDAICDFDPDPGAAEDLHAAITGLLASGASADTRNSLGNCLHNLLYSAEAQELPPSVFMRRPVTCAVFHTPAQWVWGVGHISACRGGSRDLR